MVEHPAAVRQVLGSTPSVPLFLFYNFSSFLVKRKSKKKLYGPNRDLNPGPPAPKAGIIPLDHLADDRTSNLWLEQTNLMLRGRTWKEKKRMFGSGGIRTHASEETGALNQRLRPLGHATL